MCRTRMLIDGVTRHRLRTGRTATIAETGDPLRSRLSP
jgi:hypothetical protein